MLALTLRRSPDRLAVRHLGPRQLRMDAVFLLETTQQDFEMALPQTMDQGLPELRVVLELKSGILLVEPVQPRRELVLLAADFDHHGGGRLGLGKLDRVEVNLVIPPAECVVGVGVLQLRHRADIAREQLGHLEPLPPLLDRQMTELLGNAVLVVPHLFAGLDVPGVNPE